MRFYDTHGHGLDAAYEDAQPGLSTAYGVARTSELTLFASAAFPAKPDTVAMAAAGSAAAAARRARPSTSTPPASSASWSLPDRSTPFKKSIEDGLDSVLAYYERQVDDRAWYGFWQYGDFIHSYSAPRHVWHYDWGGHAWDNTELGAPLWLWYSYLRSGRADLFRLAEAHARNTSETDTYHLGPMRGLGSRHNVVKWGDGAKEARISQAAHWRLFYYLTTDERTGDIMRESAEYAPACPSRNFDPMREAEPREPGEPPVRIRIGPDWFALAGNWMTEWERTGDTHWRDRILAGVDSIVAMPYGLETGKPEANSKALAATVGFDTATGKLTAIPESADASARARELQPRHHPGRRRGDVRAGAAARPQGLRECVAAAMPPRHCAGGCLGQGQGHAQRRRGRQYVPPGQSGAASPPTPMRKPAMSPSQRRRSRRCSPRAEALPTRIWSRARTRSARSRRTPGCRPTKPRRPDCNASRSWSSAKISCPPRPRFALPADLARARRLWPPGNHRCVKNGSLANREFHFGDRGDNCSNNAYPLNLDVAGSRNKMPQ